MFSAQLFKCSKSSNVYKLIPLKRNSGTTNKVIQIIAKQLVIIVDVAYVRKIRGTMNRIR